MGNAHPDVTIVPRSPRKSSSRRSRPRSFRDVLNVLLNAAIVSAAVHRAHKFISAAPPFVLYVRPYDIERRRYGKRTRAILISTKEINQRFSPPRSPNLRSSVRVFRIFIHSGNGEKIVYLAGQKRHSYAKAFGNLWTMQNELFDTRFGHFISFFIN